MLLAVGLGNLTSFFKKLLDHKPFHKKFDRKPPAAKQPFQKLLDRNLSGGKLDQRS
jgi:hypothetical protein